MKKLAILIYPEFSLHEVSNLMYLFRWHYDIKSVMISTSSEMITSEEGIMIKPAITVHDFNQNDYHALVLPGMSDFTQVINNNKLLEFLRGFKNEAEFPIGAICGGPLLLSLAGLLEDKKFTNSLFMDMNESFKCINIDNLEFKPVVSDGNIVTAIGNATRLFAIEIARKAGFDCSNQAMDESAIEEYTDIDYQNYLDQDGRKMMKELFKELI